MKPKGLGKGLGALIVDDALEEYIVPAQTEADINDVDVWDAQPRKLFDEEKLTELAQSIKQHGIIQPLIVTKQGDRYMIVAGERRYRAARMAGLKRVPILVKELDKAQVLELSIIENIQREDLNPMEEAQAIDMLIHEHHLTQEEVAERIGRSRSAVANTLRLLGLPEIVQNRVAAMELSAGHARALLSLRDESLMEEAAEHVIAKQLSVRETEDYVKSLVVRPETGVKKSADPNFVRAEKELSHLFDTKVRIVGNNQKGKITLSYFSEEQLYQLYDKMRELSGNE